MSIDRNGYIYPGREQTGEPVPSEVKRFLAGQTGIDADEWTWLAHDLPPSQRAAFECGVYLIQPSSARLTRPPGGDAPPYHAVSLEAALVAAGAADGIAGGADVIPVAYDEAERIAILFPRQPLAA